MRRFEIRRANFEEFRREHPLGEFMVPHLCISRREVSEFEDCIETSKKEAFLQAFLQAHPVVLVQHLRASGRFVLPRARLGAQFVCDFIIGEHHSFGYDWQVVELESPRVPLFTKAGDPRAELTHAIRQIQDWRAWLQRNQNYASRSRAEAGLGLTDITASIPGLIVMGRRFLVGPDTNERRRQMSSDLNIQIHTYDYLLERARGAVTPERSVNQ